MQDHTLFRGHTQAVSEFEDLLENAPNEVAAMAVELDILLTEALIEGHRIDAVKRIDCEIACLEEELEQAAARMLNNRVSSKAPDDFRLFSAFPNPFNSTTTLKFQLPEQSKVALSIYNIKGQKVALLARDVFEAGVHEILWEGQDVPSGVYICRLEAGGETHSIKLVLAR